MTKEDVIGLVGKDAVKEAKDDHLLLTTAPEPHQAFDDYLLFISPQAGVLKIVAYRRDIQTNGFGEEVRRTFVEIRDAVSKTYGEPKLVDFLRAGSIWGEPRDWMAG